MTLDSDLSGPRDACGVFGIYAPGQPVSHNTFLGLYALQHRGQESAGISVSDGETITVVKDMGLVTQVFDERRLAPLEGHLAVGHVRYSTTGSSTWRNAQPVYRSVGDVGFSLGHNGNLTNTVELAHELGMLPGVLSSDSELIGELLSREYSATLRSDGRDLEHALERVLPRLAGAFSLVLMDEAHVFGVRDPHGFRPLVLGRTEGGWVLASETAALDIVGRALRPRRRAGRAGRDRCHRRAVDPVRGADAQAVPLRVRVHRPSRHVPLRSERARRPAAHGRGARPPGALRRRRHGDAGARVGCAGRAGLRARIRDPVRRRLREEPLRRPYLHPADARSSAAPTCASSSTRCRDNIKGKRLVVVEDSIVRGTTTRQIIALLREAGAVEVHFRVSSPPYRWPCFYGLDTGKRSDLLAADMSVGEISDYLGVDSLAYLDLDRLVAATGSPGEAFCTACFTGDYPVPVPDHDTKLALEPGSSAQLSVDAVGRA